MDSPKGFALVNISKEPTPNDIIKMSSALTTKLAKDFSPVWNLPNLPVVPYENLDDIPNDYWKIVLTDIVTEPSDFGYHTDILGCVFAVIQVPVILKYGGSILGERGNLNDSVSSVVDHEIMEASADPQINLWNPSPSGVPDGTQTMYALEVADPVQGNFYFVNNVMMSNCVTPYWFDSTAIGQKLDIMGLVERPFLLTRGGYCITKEPDGSKKSIFGATLSPYRTSNKSNRSKFRESL